MELKIRRANLSNLNQINSLCEELLGRCVGSREEMFLNALENKDYLCLVAEIDKEVVGFIDLWAFPDVAHGAYLAQIQNFVVTKKMRGKGIGTRLLEEILKIFREKEYHELHVWAETDNQAAIRLYKKLGIKNESVLLEMEE